MTSYIAEALSWERPAPPLNPRSCLVCRKRRLRCPRNKPVCERCWNDNKQCVYDQNLRWEEESSSLGIAHGRSRKASWFGKKNPWTILALKRKNFQFLNFGIGDMDISRVLFCPSLHSDGYLPQQSIPPTPSPMPGYWPETSNELYRYYCEQVSQSMTLVDDSSNPFRRLVLPLALQNPIILTMVFALAALSLAHAGHNELHSVALRHKVYSIRLLRHTLIHSIPMVTESNMIAILMLSVFEASENEDITWSIHLCAVVDMIKASSRKEMLTFSSEVLQFVSRFFIAKEAFGGTACGKRGKMKSFPIVRTTEIDTYLGCSLELIDIISQITDLSVQAAQFTSSPSDQSVDGPLLSLRSTDAFQLWHEKKEILWHSLESITQQSSLNALSESPNWYNEDIERHHKESNTMYFPGKMLHQTSLLIHVATKLYFLACLCPIRPDQPSIQNLVREAIAVLDVLALFVVHPTLLWPIFICAVYAVDDADRVYFLDTFDVLQSHYHVHLVAKPLRKCRNIVESIWKRRDIRQQLNSENEWMEEVQPLIRGLCFR